MTDTQKIQAIKSYLEKQIAQRNEQLGKLTPEDVQHVIGSHTKGLHTGYKDLATTILNIFINEDN